MSSRSCSAGIASTSSIRSASTSSSIRRFAAQSRMREREDGCRAHGGASGASGGVLVWALAGTQSPTPASAFTPPPRVDSACVLLDVRDHPAVSVDDLDAFFRLVEAVFQFRRKQLGG